MTKSKNNVNTVFNTDDFKQNILNNINLKIDDYNKFIDSNNQLLKQGLEYINLDKVAKLTENSLTETLNSELKNSYNFDFKFKDRTLNHKVLKKDLSNNLNKVIEEISTDCIYYFLEEKAKAQEKVKHISSSNSKDKNKIEKVFQDARKYISQNKVKTTNYLSGLKTKLPKIAKNKSSDISH